MLESLPARVVGPECLQTAAPRQVSVPGQEEPPGGLCVRAEQENDPQRRQEIDQVSERLDAGGQLRSGGLAVDVPRVRVPRQDVSSVDACPGEECELAFGGLVVVLDAQKP
jgi:hypothetical protein